MRSSTKQMLAVLAVGLSSLLAMGFASPGEGGFNGGVVSNTITSTVAAGGNGIVVPAGTFICLDASCTDKILENGSNQIEFRTGSSSMGFFLHTNGQFTTNYQANLTGVKIGASGTAISSSMRATGTLDFGSAATGACSSDLTITVTGATAGAEVALDVPNGSVPAGSIFWAWVSAADTVKVRHCCLSGTTCDPASGTYSARVFNP